MVERIPFTEILTPGFSLASTQVVRGIRSYCPDIKTIIDVGANTGQFALAAHRSFPSARIYSFEPAPATRAKLNKNVRGIANITVHPEALGERTGTTTFHVTAYSHVSSILSISPENKNPNYEHQRAATIDVAVARLDDLASRLNLVGPVLLKLDVQGYEEQVLKGATETLDKVQWVVLEGSFEELYIGQPLYGKLDEFLRSRGFTLVAPVGFQRGRDGRIIEMDALYRR